MPFRRGPEINPFAGASQEPMRLLESITPVEIASCVPRVKITKIDARTGRPAEDTRPLMFDLVETPDFSNKGFGEDAGTFMERNLVSLNSAKIDFQLQYGLSLFRVVTLNFTVHKPGVVFDRFSPVPWREILEEGRSFSLEYGWIADPTIVKNDLFNGYGHVSQSGLIIKSTQTILLVVTRWTLNLKGNGEVEVVITAYENGDIALREARFSDAFEAANGYVTFGRTEDEAGDDRNAKRLKNLLDSLPTVPVTGRGNMYSMGDVLDNVIAPMIESAARAFGYGGGADGGPVELLLGNFNSRAGRQAAKYGGRSLGGVTSIGDFLVPVTKLKETLSNHFAQGRTMLLRNFIEIVLNMMNSAEAWNVMLDGQQKPEIVLKTDTVSTRGGGFRLILTVYDRKGTTDVFRDADRLPLERQSRAEIMRVLASRDVPVLEFARAGSLIQDASFEFQPDPLLQSIQVENANKDRKDRVQLTQMPDRESRKGQAGHKDIVPASVLEGSLTFYGNFVFETFGLLWIEFFGASSISGIFHILEKSDVLEPGRFLSQVKVISEGIDPLNTRRRLSDDEISAAKETADRVRKKK